MKTIAITGGNGFIGGALVAYFSALGWNVRSLERREDITTTGNITRLPFDLAQAGNFDCTNIDVLIHTAYQPILGKSSDANINVEATKILAEITKRAGVKVVFLSTLSAHKDAESIYGKTKLEMEGMFDAKNNLILRLGLVLGKGGGLFGRISQIIEKSSIVPLIGGNKPIQTISLDNICRIIEVGICTEICGIYDIAHPQVITLKTLYAEIAHSANRSPIFFPVPILPIYYLLLITEWLHLPFPFTSENVLGLKCLRAFDTTKDVAEFGITLKNYSETLRGLS